VWVKTMYVDMDTLFFIFCSFMTFLGIFAWLGFAKDKSGEYTSYFSAACLALALTGMRPSIHLWFAKVVEPRFVRHGHLTVGTKIMGALFLFAIVLEPLAIGTGRLLRKTLRLLSSPKQRQKFGSFPPQV
jgi:hypothetical protein